MNQSGVQALLDVSMSYITDREDLSEQTHAIITETLTNLFNNKISLTQATSIVNQLIGSQQPMQKISAILSMTDEPIPANARGFAENLSRHKTRPWMQYEDQRLLSAIWRYGLDNWMMIAEFVGNGRTRSQCSQRWNRGLNPKISKGSWSKEEEDKLLKLVAENGDKSWTKIATEFGNRSDVQCRYRYQQLMKDGNENKEKEENINIPQRAKSKEGFESDHEDCNASLGLKDSNRMFMSQQEFPISPVPLFPDTPKQQQNNQQYDNSSKLLKQTQSLQNISTVPELQVNLPVQQSADLFNLSFNQSTMQQTNYGQSMFQIQVQNQTTPNSQQTQKIANNNSNPPTPNTDTSSIFQDDVPKISLPKIDPSVFVEF